jgi:hypothetical protein
VRAPRANAIAERFIGTLRRGCIDRLLITGPRHLAVVLREFVEPYNAHRPHRSLHQQPPARPTPPRPRAAVRPLRRDRLGGLIHEYLHVAWRVRVLGTHTLPQVFSERIREIKSVQERIQSGDTSVFAEFSGHGCCEAAGVCLAIGLFGGPRGWPPPASKRSTAANPDRP